MKLEDLISKIDHSHPHLVFRPLEAAPARSRQLRLAADGKRSPVPGIKRIGTLFADDDQNVIRVFEDPAAEQFNLFLVSNTEDSPEGALVSVADKLNWFLLSHEGRVNIPFSTGIRPARSTINITFPEYKINIEWNRRCNDVNYQDADWGLKLCYHEHLQELEIRFEKMQTTELSKLILQLGNPADVKNAWMVPVVNRTARIHLMNPPEQPFRLMLYR